VDELPPPIDVDYSFGSYHSKTEAVGDTIRYTRTVKSRNSASPFPSRRPQKFYRIIATDERNTAVLKPVAH